MKCLCMVLESIRIEDLEWEPNIAECVCAGHRGHHNTYLVRD